MSDPTPLSDATIRKVREHHDSLRCRNCGKHIRKDDLSVTGWVHWSLLVQCKDPIYAKAEPAEQGDGSEP